MNGKNHNNVQILTYRIDVGRAPSADRIDIYLSERFPDYSRTFIKKLINDGKIEVHGKPVKPSYGPAAGDRIVARVPVIDAERVEPEDIHLDIIYEDDWILVINKPPDMVVHPSRGHRSGTLVNAAAYHCKNLSSRGDSLRPGIVHRLDRDTTGVIIMVKDNSVHEEIAGQFEARSVKKEYAAVCEGSAELDADVIDAPVGKHVSVKEKMAIRYDSGKPATTVYEVAERIGGASLVRCFPSSGRTHQIRVHLLHIGHPILCDALYGRGGEMFLSDILGGEHHPSEKPLIERQALHARRITIYHPALKKNMCFEAPLPSDIEALIGALRKAG